MNRKNVDTIQILPKSFGFDLVWFLFYGPSTHFRSFWASQLTYPHCSWASLLGSLPVLSAHSFASNWQLLFLNQRKRENGRRNVFMTKSQRKNVPDVGIELGAACMPSEHASDRATAPGCQCMYPKDADKIANSVEPDQTTQFALTCLSYSLRSLWPVALVLM